MTRLSHCRICWDQFEDPESGVATYSYQIFQLSPPHSLSASASASLPTSTSSSSVPSSASSSSSAPISSASRKLLQTPAQTPTVTPVSPQMTIDASTAPTAQLVSGLELQYGYKYYAEVTATNNADLIATSMSPPVVVKDPNHGLLIAIVVLASIGVSVLLVACLTAFIVRRRCGRSYKLHACSASFQTTPNHCVNHMSSDHFQALRPPDVSHISMKPS